MGVYLSEKEARGAIVDVGKRVYAREYVSANDGNISCRIAEDTIVVTPTAVSKGYMTEDMMVKMKLDGSILGGGRPSSEVKMHLRAYLESADVGAVVHAHPPVATSFAVMGMDMRRPVVSEGVLVTGNILVAPYAKPGSCEVPEGIAPFIARYNGVLLANHGALSWGSDLYQALYRMEAIEHQARILRDAMLLSHITGKEIPYLSREELDGLVEIRSAMGILTGGIPEA